MIQKDKTYNLATFFCLYIAQTIPMSFFSTVIPVMMRQEDFSLSAIGLLQLIKLPWILKFLWSPMVDRHAVTTDDYKRWIFSSELIFAGLIFAVAFLDFHTDFHTIVALIIVSFIASATQDIATDALAVLAFSRKDKSMANSMQSMGSFGGSMIGGGVLLLLFKQIGWNGLLPFVPKEKMERISNLHYAPVVQASVGFHDTGGLRFDAFGGLVPSCEKKDVLGILFPSACFAGRAPEEGALFSFFIGGVKHADLTTWPEEELKALIRHELHAMLKFPEETEPDMIRIFRHEHAIPQYEQSSGTRFETIDELQTAYPGLTLAGNIKGGIGMADRIRQATEIANKLINR